jgi:quercetin dioxygenase-like cupin family protein
MPIRGPVPVNLAKRDTAEVLRVGPLTIRVLEDGSRTENRVGGVLLEVPAGKSGPPMHWHRFHDELFLVTKGKPTSLLLPT